MANQYGFTMNSGGSANNPYATGLSNIFKSAGTSPVNPNIFKGASHEDVFNNIFSGGYNNLANVGGSSDLLREQLTGLITGQGNAYNQQLQQTKDQIGGVVDKNLQALRENSAQNNMNVLDPNALQDITGAGAKAINASMNASRMGAISQLLGLDESMFNRSQGLANTYLNERNMIENERQFNENIKFQKSQASAAENDWLGQTFGMLLPMGLDFLLPGLGTTTSMATGAGKAMARK